MGTTTTTRSAVEEIARRFAERDAADPEHYPEENIADLMEAGIIRGPFPEALGGRGWTLSDSVAAIAAVAAASPSTALVVSMPIGLAGVYALGAEAAPAAQRSAWADQIDRIAADYRARKLYAACNSEKGAGGSLAATTTVARRGSDGRFQLTGEKILASSGRFADVFFSTAKVTQDDLPGAGIVEFFFIETAAPGVEIMDDWDGFGMRATESQTVRYSSAAAREVMGFPNFIEAVQPLQYWYCLFSAIALGCAGSILKTMATPAPTSPALRLRYSEALMRYEALRAYLFETSAAWRPSAGPAYAARVLRTKTYVTQESTKLCAELFALGGGRHYRRSGAVARTLADSFAGTALRPPLTLALDTLVENFSLGDLGD
jgi:alkylation response protein AidB-like acyl-CoA dehydrogenase